MTVTLGKTVVNTTHGRHTWTPFCPTTWKQRPLGSCNRDGRIAQKQIFCFIISNIVHSRYEDFDFAYQLPDLDISNLNFMARRELFLSEDKREFTTNLVTLNGRLNIDLGNYAGISLNIRAVSWIFFRVNHSWCHPWRWSCARAWVLLRWFPTSLRWDRLRPWRRCCDSDCGSKADLVNGYGIIGALYELKFLWKSSWTMLGWAHGICQPEGNHLLTMVRPRSPLNQSLA